MIKVPDTYLKKTNEFLRSLNIEVKDTDNKKEIKESKSLIATFTPSGKIVIKYGGKRMNLIDSDNLKFPLDIPFKGAVKRTIVQQPKAFDMDMVLDQLEDYGKYKGILRCEGDECENYIPVSVAKKIVKARGLGGVLGYLENV